KKQSFFIPHPSSLIPLESVPVASHPSGQTERPYLLVCTLLLVIAFLYFARQVLIPLALAVLLAFILSPLVTRLQRRGLGRTSSVAVVVTLAFLALGLFGWVLSRQVTELLVQLPRYEKQIVAKFHGLRSLGEGGVIGTVRKTVEDIAHKVTGSGP